MAGFRTHITVSGVCGLLYGGAAVQPLGYSADAAVLARQLGEYPASTLTSLANYEVCCKLLDGGRSGQTYLGKTWAPSGTRFGRRENIVRRSRQRYAKSRRGVEDRITRWMSR